MATRGTDGVTTFEYEWVLLVECMGTVELHTVRATLETQGIPCRIQGEHTFGILGPVQGGIVRPRVLVPRRAVPAARAAVEDIVGPFDDSMANDDESELGSPYRNETSSPRETAARPSAPRREPLVMPALLAMTGVAPLIGACHLYMGHYRRAATLILFSVIGMVAWAAGAPWALTILGAVWLADLVGGAMSIAAHNGRVAVLEAAQPVPRHDDDDLEEPAR
ncbi:MAG: DUF2007 domain-containing protein [Deltaproteobacteria bacterium]|nr:DUF2007 domain-containing protein [Deltaproteobacteria bacterium]